MSSDLTQREGRTQRVQPSDETVVIEAQGVSDAAFDSLKAKITKDDVADLLERFSYASAKVLDHPNFDEQSRGVAVQHTAAYIITLSELVNMTEGDVIAVSSIPLVLIAAEYLNLVDAFCAE